MQYAVSSLIFKARYFNFLLGKKYLISLYVVVVGEVVGAIIPLVLSLLDNILRKLMQDYSHLEACDIHQSIYIWGL